MRRRPFSALKVVSSVNASATQQTDQQRKGRLRPPGLGVDPGAGFCAIGLGSQCWRPARGGQLRTGGQKRPSAEARLPAPTQGGVLGAHVAEPRLGPGPGEGRPGRPAGRCRWAGATGRAPGSSTVLPGRGGRSRGLERNRLLHSSDSGSNPGEGSP